MEATASQIITGYFPETKAQQKTFTEQLIEHTLSGYVSPLKIEAQIKSLEDVVKLYRSDKRIKEAVKRDFEMEYSGQNFGTMGSAEFQLKEVGVKYDFSDCGDPVWHSLTQQMEELKERLKERETVLKAHRDKWEYLDAETGETATVYPPAKTSTTQVVVTIK